MSNKIPAARAIVLWDDEPEKGKGARGGRWTRVQEVRVCDIRDQPDDAERLPFSRGACDNDWLRGDWRTTPMGVFLEIAVTDGFISQEVKIEVLREFAKIEGEDWPEVLLREMGVELEPE